jgi:D-beta-D-heptose 7-phosphate kinase/D-beta-D-heptose 1-phosphate adenosyltransferase
MSSETASLLQRIRGRRILVIGDVMLDHYFFGDATRISPEAPVPVVHVGHETYTAGGAANVALNLARLGGQAEVIGGIGIDANGDKLRARLKEGSIKFDPTFLLSDTQTITKTRVVVRNQQLCRLDHEEFPGAYRQVLAGPERLNLAEAKIKECDGIILSDYAKGVLTTTIINQLVELARKHDKFIAADPKPASGNEYKGIDLLTPNMREAVELSGIRFGADDRPDLEKICAELRGKFDLRDLVITLGADGMAISQQGRAMEYIPTAARQVYDVSGAGDTVIAALTLALTSGASLAAAANFANAAAGVVVGKLGTATVTPEELLDYIHG